MHYPKVLVISNNSFSKTDSNGRTLGNFFIGWPKDKLAQFCVSSDGANFDVCNNYYCVTDEEIVNAHLQFRKPHRTILKSIESKELQGARGTGKKTALRMIVRNMMWNDGLWNTKVFQDWVQAFNPELVLVMFSDSFFILRIATHLSEQFNIPLMMFNTEGYYFFKQNYFRTKTKWDGLWFPLYQRQFKKQVEKTMKRVSHTIYCNDLLKNDYVKKFGGECSVLYTTSTLKCEERNYTALPFKCSYIGNLTFGRPKALLEVADVLKSIDPLWKLDVYGKALKEEDEIMLRKHPNISFHGFIDYNEMLKVIKQSQILFHAESQIQRWNEGLRYGFSTKIADSLSSGACFVLYANDKIACAQYIQETGAGWFASDKTMLKMAIEDIVHNEQHRNTVLLKAKELSAQNHNILINCSKMLATINQVVENYNKYKETRANPCYQIEK